MNNKSKRVTINKNLLSYTTAMRGSWIFKASVFDEKQILVVGFNKDSGEFFTKVFLSYHQVIDFLEYISFGQPKAGFPDL
jgi:hypothetical protein